MHIDRITAISFGDIENQTLRLPGALTIVVGPNGCGKSTWHAALYAALCGLPEHDLLDVDKEFARWKPKRGQEWAVEAELTRHDDRRFRIHQDLARYRSRETELPEAWKTPEDRPSTTDLTTQFGLDRYVYGAVAWIDQRASEVDKQGLSGLTRSIDTLVRVEQIDAAISWLGVKIEELARSGGLIEQAAWRLTASTDEITRSVSVRNDHANALLLLQAASTEAELIKLRIAAADAVTRATGSGMDPGIGDLRQQLPADAPYRTPIADGAQPAPPDSEPPDEFGRSFAAGVVLAGVASAQVDGTAKTALASVAAVVLAAGAAAGLLARRRNRQSKPVAPPAEVTFIPPVVVASPDPDVTLDLEIVRQRVPQAGPELPAGVVADPLPPTKDDADENQRPGFNFWTPVTPADPPPYEQPAPEENGNNGEEQLAAALAMEAKLGEVEARLEKLTQDVDRLALGPANGEPGTRRAWTIATLQQELREANAAVQSAQIAVWNGEVKVKALESHQVLEADRDRADTYLSRLQRLMETLRSAKEGLARARNNTFHDMANGISSELRANLQNIITNQDVVDANLDEGLGVSIDERHPRRNVPGPGSDGTRQLSNILARIALGQHLGEKDWSLPLILDDSTNSIDDERLSLVLDRLQRLAHRRQVIFFTHRAKVAEWVQNRRLADDRLSLVKLTSVVDEPYVVPANSL